MESEFAQSLEERKFSFEERRNAYREFFDGTSKYWEAQEKKKQTVEVEDNGNELEVKELNPESEMLLTEYKRLLTSARFKIGVFSDEAVVRAIANYFRQPELNKPSCDNREKFTADIAIYQAMRNEMKASGKLQNSDLAMVLFGCKFKD